MSEAAAEIPLWKREFPRFAEADMPPIPAGFDDVSWHNDAMPMFLNYSNGLQIHVDYADREQSDFADCAEAKRFGLYRLVPDGQGEWCWPSDLGDDETDSTVVYTDDWNEVLAAIVGEAFAAECRDSFSEAEFAEIRVRNRKYVAEGSDACATHDFADANMIMLAAFEAVMGREPKFLEGTDEGGNHSPEGEADLLLINAAWSWAKTRHLIAGADEPTPLEAMTAEFAAYLKAEGMEGEDFEGDATELLMAAPLTAEQRAWISDFVLRWEPAQAAEDK